MKRVYITHVTRDYLEVALNLAKSVSLFSDLPLLVYCIDLQEDDKQKFNEYKNVQLRNLNLDIEGVSSTDYIEDQRGNFYVNRGSSRIYKILCAKTIAMEMALEEGWEEVCYLDSDCLATPIVDELFEYSGIIEDYPIATKGIHDYMIIVENGYQKGNPFMNRWPEPENKLSLEWPLMELLGMEENQRGIYRTTGIMIMNQNCLEFIREWRKMCYDLLDKVDVREYAPYHEETVYNVMSWRKSNVGFPLCYINLGEGLKTVEHFYSEESKEGDFGWDEEEHSQRFYRIPGDKRNIKVLHGEKRFSEVDLILNFISRVKEYDPKKIFIIGVHISNLRDDILLGRIIDQIIKEGYEYIISTHSEISSQYYKRARAVIYDSENNINLNTSSLLYYSTSDFIINSPFLNGSIYSHSEAALDLVINGILCARKMGYEIAHWIEYDTNISDFDEIKNNEKDIISGNLDFVFYSGSSVLYPIGGNFFSLNTYKVNLDELLISSEKKKDRMEKNKFSSEYYISSYLAQGVNKKIKELLYYFPEGDHSEKGNKNWILLEDEPSGKLKIFFQNGSNSDWKVKIYTKEGSREYDIKKSHWSIDSIGDKIDRFSIRLSDSCIYDFDLSNPEVYKRIVSVNSIKYF